MAERAPAVLFVARLLLRLSQLSESDGFRQENRKATSAAEQMLFLFLFFLPDNGKLKTVTLPGSGEDKPAITWDQVPIARLLTVAEYK